MAITLSEGAAERVKRFLVHRSAGVGLRVRVKDHRLAPGLPMSSRWRMASTSMTRCTKATA